MRKLESDLRQLELISPSYKGATIASRPVRRGAVAHTLLALTKQGGSCAVAHRDLQSVALHHSPPAQPLRRDTHDALDRDSAYRAHAHTEADTAHILESPTKSRPKIATITAITQLAKAHGALSVLDNTFAGFHQHGDSTSMFRAQSHEVASALAT